GAERRPEPIAPCPPRSPAPPASAPRRGRHVAGWARGRGGAEAGGGEPRSGYSPLAWNYCCCFSRSWLPRYDESANELVNEELGIAYPVIDGIPNMIPEAARRTQKQAEAVKETSGPTGPQQ
uniref:Protein preY, mitochondrial n=2 Tax=Anas TaxID=8835 RepID=A0A8B9UW59_9AVES